MKELMRLEWKASFYLYPQEGAKLRLNPDTVPPLQTEKLRTDRQVERLIHTKSLCLDLPLLNVLLCLLYLYNINIYHFI